jgi:CRISPR/Cas system-associated exonuclease Cas4 (RecB family)
VLHVSPAPLPADWEISFSTMWQGLTCPRRVAYDRTGQLRSLLARPSLAGALGHCAHTLLSRYGPRSVDKDAFEAMWISELSNAASSLRGPSTGPVPEPRSWPGYWLTYQRLRTRLIASESRTSPPARTSRDLPGSIRDETGLRLVERELRDPDRRIVGRPDLVYRDARGLICVRDYKSGYTASPERELAQLHLYAHLVEVDVGVRATVGEIDRLRGRPERVDITPRGIQDVVTKAVQARSAVLEPEPGGATTAEACSRCPFRLVCAVRATPSQEAVGDLEGTVIDTFRTAEGRLSAVVIASRETTVTLGGLESREIDIEPGEGVVVMGARGVLGGQGLLAEWATILVTEDQIQAQRCPRSQESGASEAHGVGGNHA